MRRWLRGLMAAAMLAGSVASVQGQSDEYIAPGEGGIDPGDEGERLESAVEESVWRVGRIRIDPWFALREIAWVRPPDQEGDLTASIGAGLRAYVPFSPKLTFSAQVLPHYIWWRDRDEDRRMGGTYGVGLFYFSSRARASLTASSSDLDDFVTDEADRRAEIDSVSYRLNVELPVSSWLGVFARAGRTDRTVIDTFGGDGDLADLSSTTDTLEGGLIWRATSTLALRVGAGTTETTFDESVRNRSNKGDFRLAGLDWRRSKLSANVSLRLNDLQGTAGSDFSQFDSATWQARVSWAPRPRFGVSLYGARQLNYSVEADQVFYVADRLGVRVGFPIGRRVSGNSFYEVGTREYEADGRQDDVTSVGGSLGLALRRRVRLSAGGRSTRTEGPTGSRSFYEYRIGLSFGSDRRGFF